MAQKKKFFVTVTISKEVKRKVWATTENKAVRKVKDSVIANPPKIRLKDFEQFPWTMEI